MINISLQVRYHAWIISLMPDRGSVEKVRYTTQVATALALPIDNMQNITVNVDEELIKELYLTIGDKPERLATNYNEEIKQALLPQIMDNPDLLNAIMAIAQKNADETDYIVNDGLNYLIAIKQ